MGVLGLAGGLLAVVTALLPPPASGSEELIFGSGAFLAVLGGYLLWRGPHLSEPALGAFGFMGTALITITTHEGGIAGGTADNQILYLWIVLYAYYCLALPNALIQTAGVGVAYGWLLSQQQNLPADQATTQWLVTMTTLTVAGLIVAKVRANLYLHVDELSERARHDQLTGLLNRGALDERVADERSRSNRDGTPVSVLAVDIDGFKALNDSLGHARGDEVLRKVAGALVRRTRRHDAVARIGGDEFAVLLRGASEAAAHVVAEDVRSTVAESMTMDGAGVTVSVGVATGHHPIPAFEDLLRAADGAMYAGKRAGGDRVCVTAAHGAAPAVVPEAEPVSA
jgi:diguanylate cyclase (GGDEF)-like protein